MAEQNERDPQAVASRVKEQIARGEEPVDAVEASLGGDVSDGGGAYQAGAAAGEAVSDVAGEAAEAAQGMGRRAMNATQGFANEISESLFDGDNRKEDR